MHNTNMVCYVFVALLGIWAPAVLYTLTHGGVKVTFLLLARMAVQTIYCINGKTLVATEKTLKKKIKDHKKSRKKQMNGMHKGKMNAFIGRANRNHLYDDHQKRIRDFMNTNFDLMEFKEICNLLDKVDLRNQNEKTRNLHITKMKMLKISLKNYESLCDKAERKYHAMMNRTGNFWFFALQTMIQRIYHGGNTKKTGDDFEKVVKAYFSALLPGGDVYTNVKVTGGEIDYHDETNKVVVEAKNNPGDLACAIQQVHRNTRALCAQEHEYSEYVVTNLGLSLPCELGVKTINTMYSYRVFGAYQTLACEFAKFFYVLMSHKFWVTRFHGRLLLVVVAEKQR